jgi:hypothetical protein
MKNNRDLLKEAIADAKAVKETAIANAKAALEEAFTPQIKSMLSQRLSEMEEEDENMNEMDEYKNYNPSPSKKDKKYVSDLDEMEETDEMDELDEMEETDEMDELYEEEEEIDEIDLEELLAELESEEEFQDDEQDIDSDFLNEAEEEEEETEEEEEEETEEEEGGEESEEDMNIEDMDEDDLKSFIEDVIKDMVSAGDLAPGESEGTEDSEEESKPIDEYSLEELLAEIKKLNDKEEVDEILGGLGKKVGEFLGGAAQKAVNDFKTTYKADLAALKTAEKDAEENPEALKTIQDKLLKAYDSWAAGAVKKFNVDPADFKNVVKKELNDLITNVTPGDTRSLAQKLGTGAGGAVRGGMSKGSFGETKQLKKELDEAYSAINTLRSELNEVNVLNAKLLYTNKIFKNRSLNETQKVKVLTAFDKANSVKEAKLVYETLLENLKTTKSSVNESLGFASKAMGTSTKSPIVESNMMVDRFKKLAGII